VELIKMFKDALDWEHTIFQKAKTGLQQVRLYWLVWNIPSVMNTYRTIGLKGYGTIGLKDCRTIGQVVTEWSDIFKDVLRPNRWTYL